MLYQHMQKKSQYLNSQIKSLQEQISKLPSGNLRCVKERRQTKWYHTVNHNSLYLSKEDRPLAEQLAYKKYLSLLHQSALHEKKAIDSYLSLHDETADQKIQKFLSHPSYQELLPAAVSPLSKDLQEWIQTPYEKNPFHPEQRVYSAVQGIMVRSKSEVIICMALYMNQIPFRYECPLTIDGQTFYPDFTIRHPKTGKVFYWEHFGMMDQPDYAKHTFSKIQWYTKHQIFPDIQLITTYETSQTPLSAEWVNTIIQHYFL